MRTAVWFTAIGSIGNKADMLRAALQNSAHVIPEDTVRSEHKHAVVVFSPDDKEVDSFAHRLIASQELSILGVSASPDFVAPQFVWKLLEAGMRDIIRWQGSAETTGELVAERTRRWAEVQSVVDSELVRKNLVGCSKAWQKSVRAIVEAASYSNAPILLSGESGTGKELCARLIHKLDTRRAQRELIIVDCTTLIPELSGSELFGHERGAFTGANAARDGAFALADGGTLFLDEIGELAPRLQAQFLRSIQERRYKRVGGNEWRSSNFRLICATNRDLAAEVAQGRFRSDLYYRIAGCSIALPPLRERSEDILPLCRHFLCEILGRAEPPDIDPAVEIILLDRGFPCGFRRSRPCIPN